MRILVVGGAGYIGSHMVKKLAVNGCLVTTLDNLSTGHRDSVLWGNFVFGDVADRVLLQNLFATHKFDAVMHFASFSQVGESVYQPAKYYLNNVANTLSLLEAMRVAKIDRLVFSSTAAVFGAPWDAPFDENHNRDPVSPYGRSKLMIEQILADYDYAYGLKSVVLRYFNAAGADPEGMLGERHDPETHLIPLVLRVASGRCASVSIFGQDYETPDGTCLRDYVHVSDLCEAHWRALISLQHNEKSQSYNLGSGRGFSVLEVINKARAVTGREIKVNDCPRRAGDPARLVANSFLAKEKLGWQPRYSDLETIIQHAWNWEKKNVNF